jgi:MFS family permease
MGALGLVGGGLLGLGLLEGSSGAIWPDVIASFDVSKGQFGLASGVGLTIAFPIQVFGGRITTNYDKRSLLAIAAAAMVLAAVGLATGYGFAALALWMMIRGIGICLLDLTSNALAMEVEADTQRHLMSPLHAGYSGGTVVGAGLAWVVFRLGGSFKAVFVILIVLLAGYAGFAVRERFVRSMRRRRTEIVGGSLGAFRLYRRADIRLLAALCGVSFCGELLIAQWIGIYLRDERGNSAAVGVWAVLMLGGSMFAGRLVNAPVTNRLGPRAALFVQGLLLATGGGLIVASDSAAVSIAGCGVAGIGLAGMAPTALSLAGLALPNAPGSASGAALTGGYLGVTLIPYLAGGVASISSVRTVLTVEILFGVLVVLAASGLNRWIDTQRPGTGG